MKHEINSDEFKHYKKELLQKGSIQCQIVSGSMEPIIKTSDLVTVEPLIEEPKHFDILVFWEKNKFICHYLYHLNRKSSSSSESIYITRSLRNSAEDLPLPRSHVLGVVVSHQLSFVRKAKIILIRLKERIGS